MKLLENNTIGNLLLKNRIGFPPITTGFGAIDGCLGDDDIDFAVERAKGGAALIFTEAVSTSRHHLLPVSIPLPYLDNDEQIGKYSRYVDFIHHNGAKTCIQLYHAGRQMSWNKCGGKLPLSPSPVTTLLLDRIPFPNSVEMSDVEIERTIQDFALAAGRAKNAGFDAIDIDGGAGYLIQQFMSPLTNKRKDKWGGNLEKRLRFPIEIITRIRYVVGDDFPLIFDLCLNEYREGGIMPETGIEIAKTLEQYGIDAFRIHGVTLETYHYMFPTIGSPDGVNIPLGKLLKHNLRSAKVLLGQQIHSPELAESALHENAADIILLGRPLIADPYFPKKVMLGKNASIRKCIACNHCVDSLAYARPIRCALNPVVGFESKYSKLPRTKNPKKVLVIGGGPAGMENARVAAKIGHHVILAEKNTILGGQLNYAASTPHKEAISFIIDYYKNRLDELNIDIRLNLNVNRETVAALRPDAITLATGSLPLQPQIPGVNKAHVINALDVIKNRNIISNNASVVIVGGGTLGTEIAEMIALKKIKVTLLEKKHSIADKMGILLAISLHERLTKLSIDIITDACVVSICDHDVHYINTHGHETSIDADHVILATGYRTNHALETDLYDFTGSLSIIGDCYSPRKIINAIHEGFHAARVLE